MDREFRIRQFLNRLIFSIYLITLVYLIIFKGPIIYKVVSPLDYTLYEMSWSQEGSWGYNLVPFQTIKAYFDDKQFHIPGSGVSNVFGNIILIMPFGFLFPLVFPKASAISKVILAVLLLSIVFEAIQYIANLGFSDIDDVILNVTGGILGYWFYYYLYR